MYLPLFDSSRYFSICKSSMCSIAAFFLVDDFYSSHTIVMMPDYVPQYCNNLDRTCKYFQMMPTFYFYLGSFSRFPIQSSLQIWIPIRSLIGKFFLLLLIVHPFLSPVLYSHAIEVLHTINVFILEENDERFSNGDTHWFQYFCRKNRGESCSFPSSIQL